MKVGRLDPVVHESGDAESPLPVDGDDRTRLTDEALLSIPEHEFGWQPETAGGRGRNGSDGAGADRDRGDEGCQPSGGPLDRKSVV